MVAIRCGSLSCCDVKCFKISSLGNLIGLNHVTLRYSTPGEETGYLYHCIREFVKVWPIFAFVYALITINSLFRTARSIGWPWQQSNDRFLVETILFSQRCGGVAFIGAHLIIVKSSKWMRYCGDLNLERSLVCFCVYCSAQCLGRFYITKMLGHDDPYELYSRDELPSSHTDTPFVLQLFGVLVISHACSLRWCSLLVVEIAIAVIYGIVVWLWSTEPTKWQCLVNLVCMVFVSSYGKRQLEVNDRLVFSSLINEKTLRMKAEFQLSRQPQEQQKDEVRSTCEHSIPETTTTGEVFGGLDPEACIPSSLNMLCELGKRENWLIDEKELAVDSHTCLGVGGFGIVLAGEFNASPAAFKIHKSLGMNKNLLAIGNELRLLRKLRHSNIVLFHGACLSLQRNDIVVVMERVFGMCMFSFVNGKPSASENVQVLIGICHGLMYLHTRQPAIVHGDLKPANVMVEQRGLKLHAKILDFGLARLITIKTKPGGGTCRWLAPEMMRNGCAPSVHTDVFALGLILFFASTGRLPFEDLSVETLKSYSRSNSESGLALMWPMESSDLAVHCKPIVDSATRKLPHERPSVQDACGWISEITQCDSPRPVVGGHAGNLWGSLTFARQSASKNNPNRLRSRRWLNKIKFVQDLPRLRCIETVKEELEGPSTTNCSVSRNLEASLFHPGLAVTPPMYMKISILEAVMSWNLKLPLNACCEYHAVLAALFSLQQELQGYPCRRVRPPGSMFEQCPVCCSVVPQEGEAGVEKDFCCKLCGFMGPPRRCESPHASKDQSLDAEDFTSATVTIEKVTL